MDAVAAVARITRVQGALEVVAALMLTAYLFPRQAVVVDRQQFDFIVVGAGSAGSVVAARLAQGGHGVLLVEAGGDPPQESLIPSLFVFPTMSRNDWNYTTEKDNRSFQCHRSKTGYLTTGRVLGGGSSINYMLYIRGCPGDYDSWAEAAQDDAWSWNEVLPYFIKSERLQDQEITDSISSVYHGTEGFLGVTRQKSPQMKKYLKSFREVGHETILDINSQHHMGYYQPMLTISDGFRQSTAYSILRETKDNKNLHVLKNTHVNRIIFDDNNNAVGIEATTTDNKHITLRARKEVIVSAGALNTPRLLMLSGIGPQNHLDSFNIPVRSDLPVGENLQDHLAFLMATKLEESTMPPPVQDPHRYPVDMIIGHVALNKSSYCPLYQTFSSIVPNSGTGALNLCAFNLGFNFEICQEIYEAGRDRLVLFTVIDLLRPKSRGSVLLRSTNPADPPLVHSFYASDEQDLEAIVDSAMDFVKVYNTSYFRKINAEMVTIKSVCTEFRVWSRDWWRCYVKCLMFPFYHFAGTCALGSVVDSHLRVLGVNRLRVADASIMPEIVRANTNAASIMIGEKAADFIKQDHGSNSQENVFSSHPCSDSPSVGSH